MTVSKGISCTHYRGLLQWGLFKRLFRGKVYSANCRQTDKTISNPTLVPLYGPSMYMLSKHHKHDERANVTSAVWGSEKHQSVKALKSLN